MVPETQQTHMEKRGSVRKKTAGFFQQVRQRTAPLQDFFAKCNNDWVMNFASGLSFTFLTALFPIAIAIIAITGLVVGNLNPHAQDQLVASIDALFPSVLSTHGQTILKPALISLSQHAGFLNILSLLLALFGGSRLFVTLEGYFDIIYHTQPRKVIRQNIMALVLMLIFTILVPLMIFAGACAPLISSFLESTPPGRIPFVSLFFSLASYGFGILCAWIFFLAIYMVVPNRRISFRKSWLGALVAALLVQLYLMLFPLYVSHFLNTYTGSAGAIGFAVVFLFFLYYFALILLLGAEVNAFVAEKIHATPSSIPGMLYQIEGYAPPEEQDAERSTTDQATPKQMDLAPAPAEHEPSAQEPTLYQTPAAAPTAVRAEETVADT